MFMALRIINLDRKLWECLISVPQFLDPHLGTLDSLRWLNDGVLASFGAIFMGISGDWCGLQWGPQLGLQLNPYELCLASPCGLASHTEQKLHGTGISYEVAQANQSECFSMQHRRCPTFCNTALEGHTASFPIHPLVINKWLNLVQIQREETQTPPVSWMSVKDLQRKLPHAWMSE